MEKYIVISAGEPIRFETLTKGELQKRLNESYWGEDIKILNRLPPESDPNYWDMEETIIILKPEFIVPKPVTTVTRYKI